MLAWPFNRLERVLIRLKTFTQNNKRRRKALFVYNIRMTKLDDIALNIELVLISIIEGVALTAKRFNLPRPSSEC